MNKNALACAVILFVCLVQARSAEPDGKLLPPVETTAADAKEQLKQPEKDKKLTEPPKIDLFAPAAVMGPQFATGFNPHMMGDFAGTFARQFITVSGTQTTTTRTVIPDSQPLLFTTTTTTVPTSQTRIVVVPVLSAAAFRVAENESPRPQDRVFFTYNFFGNIRGPHGAGNEPINTTQTINTPNGTVVTTTAIPATPNPSANLHREVFGFEKTFLNGAASIELRVPLLQQQSNVEGFSSGNIGDITILGKYAFILNPDTGNVLSAGLAVTAPTGPSIETIDGTVHSTLLQPWFGYIVNFDRFFVQGFHSLAVPTDPRDVTLLFNDVGVSYWLLRDSPDRVLRYVVPTLEAHVTTPLNHRDLNGPIFVPDLVVLTAGVHLGVSQNAALSLGIATPVTGPRTFGIEAFVQFNRRF